MHDAVTVQDWWLARSPMTPYSCTDGKMCLSPRFLYPNTFDSLKNVMKLAPPPRAQCLGDTKIRTLLLHRLAPTLSDN